MRPLPVTWLVASTLPVLLLVAAPLVPRGTDPRGFGPRFAVGIDACIASLVLGIVGLALFVFAERLQLGRTFILATTLVAAAPFMYLVATVLLGRA